MKHYRPEIDGLRAVAVLAVVLYHAEFGLWGGTFFAGGFLGVDVFFVISGYLICSIILRELEQGRFSFANFYNRRARRILPALLTVMAASLPFAWLVLRPNALREYAASGLATFGFSSNIWFWLEDSYIAEPSMLKPLLHTWSLAVEEQFYFVFPVLLVLNWRFGRRVFLRVFLVLAAASLAAAHHASTNAPEAAFYLLPFRGWELLAGAMLARLELTRGRNPARHLAMALPVIGLAMLVWPFAGWDDRVQHPSIVTAIPVVGTMMLIWFTRPGGWVTRLLSWKPMVGIGLISYSLYLWHFPIFALSRVHYGQIGVMGKWILIGVSIGLSVLSYYLVERPARDRKRSSNRTFAIVIAIIAVTIAAIFGQAYVASSRQIAGFSFESESFNIGAEKNKRLKPGRAACRQRFWNSCVEGQESGRILLFVGDSTSFDALNILAPLFPDHDVVINELGGCPPTPSIRAIARPRNPNIAECSELNEVRFDSRSLKGVDVLVVSVTYAWFQPEHLRPYLDFLAENHVRRVVLLGNYIRMNEQFPFVARELGIREDIAMDMSALGEYVTEAFAFEVELELLAEEYGATFLSLRDLACSGGDCAVFVDGIPFSWDRVHFSYEFSQYLSGRVDLSGLR